MTPASGAIRYFADELLEVFARQRGGTRGEVVEAPVADGDPESKALVDVDVTAAGQAQIVAVHTEGVTDGVGDRLGQAGQLP
nr:hypothetical protein [Prescottella equi]